MILKADEASVYQEYFCRRLTERNSALNVQVDRVISDVNDEISRLQIKLDGNLQL